MEEYRGGNKMMTDETLGDKRETDQEVSLLR